jgi:Zn-finger nucleic acid-binding protein
MAELKSCPCCKSENITQLIIYSPSGDVRIIHIGSGSVGINVCKKCGTLFLNEYDLKKMNEDELRKKGGEQK